MSGRLHDKVALITGAARGQGRAHAVMLAGEGADIIALDLPIQSQQGSVAQAGDPVSATLQETQRRVEALGRRCVVASADVAVEADMQRATLRGIEALGGVDIVVANAGMARKAPLLEAPKAHWDLMVSVLLLGAVNTCKYAVPSMIERGGGSIILTESINAYIAAPNLGAYTAIRHGGHGLVLAMANELGPHGIRVNAICPGVVQPGTVDGGYDSEDQKARFSQEYTGKHLLPKPFVTWDCIARTVAFLASEDSACITGVSLPIDNGLIAKSPFFDGFW